MTTNKYKQGINNFDTPYIVGKIVRNAKDLVDEVETKENNGSPELNVTLNGKLVEEIQRAGEIKSVVDNNYIFGRIMIDRQAFPVKGQLLSEIKLLSDKLGLDLVTVWSTAKKKGEEKRPRKY